MEISQNRRLTKDIYALDLVGEFPYDKVKPGQFVNILIGSGQEHPLRRPLSIASCNSQERVLTVIYRVVGAGTKWLSNQKEGDLLNVLGPLGNGFPLPESPGKVVVIGGGVGVPPLYQLVKELASRNCSVDIVLGFRDQSDAFWLKEFGKFGEVRVCTEDGSLGVQGFVTAALKLSETWTSLYACGPKPMLQALKTHFADSTITGYVSLEERMACGVGACWGCTCQTSDGLETKRVCKEGPVFHWEEVLY